MIDRFWLESIAAKDADTAEKAFRQRQGKELFACWRDKDWYQSEKPADEKMLLAYETGGIDACMALLTKTCQRNMKKLKEGGIL